MERIVFPSRRNSWRARSRMCSDWVRYSAIQPTMRTSPHGACLHPTMCTAVPIEAPRDRVEVLRMSRNPFLSHTLPDPDPDIAKDPRQRIPGPSHDHTRMDQRMSANCIFFYYQEIGTYTTLLHNKYPDEKSRSVYTLEWRYSLAFVLI
jgi:hypothetical protein